jgi:hypothetical protein
MRYPERCRFTRLRLRRCVNGRCAAKPLTTDADDAKASRSRLVAFPFGVGIEDVRQPRWQGADRRGTFTENA